jgi:MFS superfamily sulfate permease-like transporter
MANPAGFIIQPDHYRGGLVGGLMIGILMAVALAIILVLHRLNRPHETVFRPAKTPGLLIYRFGAPLFFFNANYFALRVREMINTARPQVNFLLINAEAIVDMECRRDVGPASATLSRGIVLGICNMGIFRCFRVAGFIPGPLYLYPTSRRDE